MIQDYINKVETAEKNQEETHLSGKYLSYTFKKKKLNDNTNCIL